jgi:hypothetical protein
MSSPPPTKPPLDDDEPTLEAPPDVMQLFLSQNESTRRIPAARMKELLDSLPPDVGLEAEEPTPAPSDLEAYLRERLRDL